MPLHSCAGTDASQGVWNQSGSPRRMRWFAGSEAEGEVRVQNADGSVEVQPDEEPWDGSPATSSSDVSTSPLPASPPLSQAVGQARMVHSSVSSSHMLGAGLDNTQSRLHPEGWRRGRAMSMSCFLYM